MVDDPSELLSNIDNLAHHCPDRLEKQGQWQKLVMTIMPIMVDCIMIIMVDCIMMMITCGLM